MLSVNKHALVDNGIGWLSTPRVACFGICLSELLHCTTSPTLYFTRRSISVSVQISGYWRCLMQWIGSPTSMLNLRKLVYMVDHWCQPNSICMLDVFVFVFVCCPWFSSSVFSVRVCHTLYVVLRVVEHLIISHLQIHTEEFTHYWFSFTLACGVCRHNACCVSMIIYFYNLDVMTIVWLFWKVI